MSSRCGKASCLKRSALPPSFPYAASPAIAGVPALLTGNAYRSTPPTLFPGVRLDHNRGGHVRMQGAKILVGARYRECEREIVVGVERVRFERHRFRHHG